MSPRLKLVEGFVYWFNSSKNIYASALWNSCPAILLDKANAPILAVVMLKPHWSKDELYADCEELHLCNGQKLNNGHKVDVEHLYTVHSAMLSSYDEMRPNELYLDHDSFVTIQKAVKTLKLTPLRVLVPGNVGKAFDSSSSYINETNKLPETPPSKRRWTSMMSTQSNIDSTEVWTPKESQMSSRASFVEGPSDFIQIPTMPDLLSTKPSITSSKLPTLQISKSSIRERLQQTIGQKDRFRVSIPPLQSPRAFQPVREIFVKNETKEAADLIYEAVQKAFKAQEHVSILDTKDIGEVVKWALEREAVATVMARLMRREK